MGESGEGRDILNAIYKAGEAGDMVKVAELTAKFAEFGNKKAQDLNEQGYNELEILTGAWLPDQRQKKDIGLNFRGQQYEVDQKRPYELADNYRISKLSNPKE